MKWILGLIVMAVVVVSGFLFSLNKDPKVYLGVLQSAVENATGRKLLVNGPVKLSIFPNPTLELHDVALSNSPWGSRLQMIHVARMGAQLDLKRLVFGEVRFRYVRMSGVDMLLERNARGEGNWDMGASGDARAKSKQQVPDKGGVATLLQFGHLKLVDGKVTYREPKKDPVALDINRLDVRPASGGLTAKADLNWKTRALHLDARLVLRDQTWDANLTGEGVNAKLNGVLADAQKPIVLSLGLDTPSVLNSLLGVNLPDLGRIAASGEFSPSDQRFRVKLDHEAFTANVSGVVDKPVSVSLTIAQPQALADRLQVWMPPVAPVSIQADIATEKEQGVVNVSKLSVKLGETDLTGELNLQQEPLKVVAHVRSNRLRLRDITSGDSAAEKLSGESAGDEQGAETAASPQKASGVFPKEKLALDWMNGLDVKLDANVAALELGPQIMLSDVALDGGIRNRRLTVRKASAQWSGGQWQGGLALDNAQEPATIRANLEAQGVQLAEMIPDSDTWLNGGEMRLSADLQGKGGSAHDVAASISGKFEMRMAKIAVAASGLKLVAGGLLAQTLGALKPGKKQDDKDDGNRQGFTRFDCAVAHFDINQGVASAPETIGIESKYFNIGGEGEIDLGKETLDLHFIPKPRKGLGISLSTVSNIVMLGGTLADPKLQVGGKELLKSGASITAALATGGTSLLVQSLFNRVTAEQFSCESTLKRIAEAKDALVKTRTIDSQSAGATALSGGQ